MEKLKSNQMFTPFETNQVKNLSQFKGGQTVHTYTVNAYGATLHEYKTTNGDYQEVWLSVDDLRWQL